MNCLPPLFLALGLFVFPLRGIAADMYHQWTDVKGRTITAAFVKADDNTVTVRMQGQLGGIRISDLSPQTRDMLGKLFSANKDTPGPDRNAFLDWTDKTGRTIRARLVKVVGDNLTIELEGPLYDLPLAQLSPETQELAKTLIIPTKEPAPEPVVGKDGPQEWKDVNGKAIRARFIKLAGETLTIEMNGQPFDLPLVRLSPDSQALARKLAGNAKPPPDKTPQEKPVDEKITKAMENGPPDQAEITLALNADVLDARCKPGFRKFYFQLIRFYLLGVRGDLQHIVASGILGFNNIHFAKSLINYSVSLLTSGGFWNYPLIR